MKKRLLCLAMCLLTILTLIGCSNSNSQGTESGEVDSTEKVTPLEVSFVVSKETQGVELDTGNELYDIILNQDVKEINFYSLEFNAETNKFTRINNPCSFSEVSSSVYHTIRYTVPKDIANLSMEVISYSDEVKEFIITYDTETNTAILVEATFDNMEK